MYKVLIVQFYIYLILVLAGYISSKIKIITSENSSFLKDFILKVTFPLLIFTTITHQPLNKDIFHNLIIVFGFSYLVMILLIGLGRFGSSILKLEGESKKIHILHTVFGNVVFIGFPFIGALFPDGSGIFYAAMFQLVSDSILWTYGILYFRNNGKNNIKEIAKNLFNINTVVFLIALICWLFQFSLPLSIEKPFRDLGHSTLVLSLVYIGYILSTIDIEKTFKKVSIYVLTVNKMIIAPLIVLFIIMQFRHYFPWLNKAAISAIILETGMPAMATIAILAKNYNSDFKLASENILVTTVLSIFTLPLLWFLINLIYK